MTVRRSDWLLLFLDADALGVDGPSQLDPVRIQKGLFLLNQRGPHRARGTYSFRPYNWGPFSSELYADLDIMSWQSLVDVESVPGRTWQRYSVSPVGHARAEEIAAELDEGELDWLGRARKFVTSRSFPKLLEDVYEAFPEYATQSHFRQ